MPAEKYYGVVGQKQLNKAIDVHVEELLINGFSVLESVLDEEMLRTARKKLDAIYQEQENYFGYDNLSRIKELNLARCPLVYDEFFLGIATNATVIEIVKVIIGDYIVLHLQNGVINRPNEEHHQSSWHRDLPYQNFTISKPLAIGALFCIDDFTPVSGATFVLPFSHKIETIPSQTYIEKFGKQVIAKSGSVILFDAMLFHKAGYNSADFVRRAINNVYSVPILKQQINLQSALNGKYGDDSFLSKFLGYDTNVADSDIIYRKHRISRL